MSFLSSQPARIYSVAHPLLLLSLLAIRFQRLVSDPVTELLNDLPVLAILQLSYVMICLPPAGSGPGSKPADSDEKKPSQGQLRAGKPGYRRRQAKSDVGGISMKLIVRRPSLSTCSLE